jgi:ADP-ribosyl-[dinitrogen reductase] hydrolase
MFYFPHHRLATKYAAESSRTTHATAECLDACRLLAGIVLRALGGLGKEEVLLAESETFSGAEKIMAIASGEYQDKAAGQIRGSGYVVESLEAALWCFLNTDTFESAILRAANLGDDADTTAAVCGQLAGAYYGVSAIPTHWLERLALREQISEIAEALYHGSDAI